MGVRTAAQLNLAACTTCGLVSRTPTPDMRLTCPRCGDDLSSRKPNSLVRTWALLISAVALYIPANLLPVMETYTLANAQIDTIMSGILYLWITGSWGIAAIVFTASVVVPLAKIVSLAYLAISVHKRSQWQPHQRAKLYRLLEMIGKWSMLDIYVVALLGTLVNFSALMSVRAGSGALAFAGVVIATLLAAQSFDPRLIWDAADNRHD